MLGAFNYHGSRSILWRCRMYLQSSFDDNENTFEELVAHMECWSSCFMPSNSCSTERLFDFLFAFQLTHLFFQATHLLLSVWQLTFIHSFSSCLIYFLQIILSSLGPLCHGNSSSILGEFSMQAKEEKIAASLFITIS